MVDGVYILCAVHITMFRNNAYFAMIKYTVGNVVFDFNFNKFECL